MRMKQVNTLTVLCLICLVSCDLQSAFEEHLKRVSEKHYPCRNPQPRTIHVKELVDEERWTNISGGVILPRRTVLHRCTSSGCCNDANSICQQSAEEEVTLTFYIVGNGYLEINADNHTSCSCQPSANNIKK